MSLKERREAMIARHAEEIERAVKQHQSVLTHMMERQHLELIELMLVEDPRQKPNDVIDLLRKEARDWMFGEAPCSAEYCDGEEMLRLLDRFAAKLPTQDGE